MTGDELKELRTRLGMTQDELGQRLGVARVTVARWEIGLRRVPELAAKSKRKTLVHSSSKG